MASGKFYALLNLAIGIPTGMHCLGCNDIDTAT